MNLQKINSYLKLFLIVGFPIVVFLTIFFSLLMGFKEGLIPGLLIGLCIGSILSIVLGFFYSKSTKEAISSLLEEIKLPKDKRKNLMIVLLPFFILLLGAIYSRYSEKILLSYMLTMILSIAVTAFYYLGKFKRPLREGELIIYIASIATLLIPLTITYFIFLLVIYGFNFQIIRNLFK